MACCLYEVFVVIGYQCGLVTAVALGNGERMMAHGPVICVFFGRRLGCIVIFPYASDDVLHMARIRSGGGW